MDRKILIIDGMYFAQRVLGQINMGDSVNNLVTDAEQSAFRASLNNSLVNLWNTFSNSGVNLIDNIIFVTDCGSWRKDVTPFRPYYIPEDSEQVIGYKEQRKAKKEESPINYDNFYRITNEFVESIRDKVIVFKINKLEGDDNIMLLSNKLKEYPNILSIIFATDGDLDQVVRDNVFIMRNIRSKDAPNGEYVITLNMYGKIFEQSTESALLGSSLDTKFYRDLFSIQIGNIDGTSKIQRSLNRGISIATPFRTALVKSVAGDKKDNIFSLISWKSSTGTRQYNITEKYIEKALEKHGYALTESNCQKVLTSKENLVNLMLSLKEVTKQNTVELEGILKHLKHNLKINMLSVNNVPEEYRNEWQKCWDENQERILHETLDYKNLAKLASVNNYNPKASGTNVLADSIPEL
jgi:hypothetical protein